MKNLLNVVLVFALAATLTACKKNVKDDANADLTAGTNSGVEMTLEETTVEDVTIPTQEVALGAVYFALDKATLTSDARKIVEANAQAIKSAATVANYKVTVEGNCDDRGTTSYNIALGQTPRRNALKRQIRLFWQGARTHEKLYETYFYGRFGLFAVRLYCQSKRYQHA